MLQGHTFCNNIRLAFPPNSGQRKTLLENFPLPSFSLLCLPLPSRYTLLPLPAGLRKQVPSSHLLEEPYCIRFQCLGSNIKWNQHLNLNHWPLSSSLIFGVALLWPSGFLFITWIYWILLHWTSIYKREIHWDYTWKKKPNTWDKEKQQRNSALRKCFQLFWSTIEKQLISYIH